MFSLWNATKAWLGYETYTPLSQETLRNDGYAFYKLFEYLKFSPLYLGQKCIYFHEPILVNFELAKKFHNDGCYNIYIVSYGPRFYNYGIDYCKLKSICDDGRFVQKYHNKDLYVSLKKDMLDHIRKGCDCSNK